MYNNRFAHFPQAGYLSISNSKTNPTAPKVFWSFTFQKHEKAVANLWECDIGHEIMRLMTKSWNLASLNLIFKFYLCYIQQLILIIA